MAGRIARLLRHQSPEPPEVKAAAAQLAHLAEAYPDLRHAAAVQTALLRAVYAVSAPVSPHPMATADVAARLAGGRPLLRDATLPCATPHLRDTFLRLCTAACRASAAPDAAAPYATLMAAVKAQRLDVGFCGSELLTDRASLLPAHLEAQGYPAGLVMTLLRLTLLPFLEQIAAQLAPLAAPYPWGRGYCPVCGAWPVLAEQRGLEQWRYLRCGLCASSWAVDRLLCPFCTNRDHLLLGYLQVEGEEQQQRIATCNACQGYLKLRSTLTPLTTPQLLAAEVALVHLDLLAMQNGYMVMH